MSVRKVRDALVVMIAFLALIWILQVFNWADGYRLDAQFGILPHHVSRIPDIFTAPFLHFSWQHIEGNSVPLLVLGFLTAYRGLAKFALVTFIVAVISGLGVWLFQNGELTVGASGLIFGYFGYVLLRGIFDRNLLDIGVGVVAGALYWTILSVAIPGTPGISWIGHLTGLIGGVVAAWILRSPSSAPLLKRRPAAVPGPGGDAGGRGPRTDGGTGAREPRADGGTGARGSRADGGTGGWGSRADGGTGSGEGADGGTSGAASSRGHDGQPRNGRTRALGSAAADELLRKIDEMGI